MIAASIPAASRNEAVAPPPAAATPSVADATPVQSAKPNPSSQLDLTLGITVLTFHDASGQVVATTPTQQQLNTYLLFGSPGHTAAKPSAEPGDGSGVAMLA